MSKAEELKKLKEQEFLVALEKELADYTVKGMTERADAVKKEIAKIKPAKKETKKDA